MFSEMRMVKKTHPSLTSLDVLEMATTRPARALKRESDLGKIKPGYLADSIAIPFKGAESDVFDSVIQNRGAIKWMMVNGKVLT
jgi:imidazolonepropionase-like amidohydrolase